MLYLFWVWNWNSEGVRILENFLHRPMLSEPHQWKALAETFWMKWLNIGLSWKITKIRTNPVLVSHPKQVQHSQIGIFVFTVKQYNAEWRSNRADVNDTITKPRSTLDNRCQSWYKYNLNLDHGWYTIKILKVKLWIIGLERKYSLTTRHYFKLLRKLKEGSEVSEAATKRARAGDEAHPSLHRTYCFLISLLSKPLFLPFYQTSA